MLALLSASCSTLPRAEITAYTSAYSEILTITNGLLDIVSPYERIVIRSASPTSLVVPSDLHRRTDVTPMIREAYAQAAEDPSLRAPRPSSTADPSQVSSQPFPSGAAVREDPSLVAPRPVQRSPVQPPPVQRPAATPSRTIALPGICTRRVAGDDPYCYEMRDGYADIGDPPLVGAYRTISNVVLRFNALLIAYADGVSGRLLQQELSGLAGSVTELSKVSSFAGFSQGPAFAASFSALIEGLSPVVTLAGSLIDRSELRRFLLTNYNTVDEAFVLMAKDSVDLYSTVAVGTNLFRRLAKPGTDQALVVRRREIRRLISNWTVLLDDTRRLLGELKMAVESSDGLDSRLANLDGTLRARIDASSIRKQVATLGTPALGP